MTDIRFARHEFATPSITVALGRAEDPREAVDVFLDAVAGIADADVLALALADEEADRASGFAIRGGDETWFRSVSIDLANDIGGIATVARERIAFTVYDAAAAANVNQHLVEALNVKSAAFVPMTAEERFVGALVVASCTDHRHFPTELVEAIQRLADETAPVLRRMRSADALRRALERERLVGEIARKVRSELDLDDVLDVAVGEIGRGLGVARCFIRLGTSPEGASVRAEWAAPGIEPIGTTVPERLAVSNLALRESRTIAIGDIEDAPALDDETLGGRAALTALGTKAALATPVLVFDQQVGVFSLHRTHTGAWSANDIAIAETVAGEVGVAIHVARLLTDDERQARIQLGFFRIAEVLGSPLTLGQTLDALARAAAEALGGDAAFVLEPAGSLLRLAGSYELPPKLAAALAEGIPAAQTPLADAGRKGRMVVSSLRDDDRFDPAARELLTKSGYASLCAAPVARGESDFASVVVVFKTDHEFTDDDLTVAGHLSDAARGALERSELYESERRGRMLSDYLATVGARLVTGLSPERVTEEIAIAARELLAADAAVVRTLVGDELVVVAGSGERAAEAVGTRSSSGAGLLGDVAQSRSPGQVEDILAAPRLASEDTLLTHGMAASAVVPMPGPGGLGGMLSVYSASPRAWRTDETQALAALAAMASAALANAELYRSVAEEKERSEAILGNIADGIVAVDRDGTIVLWNATAAQITGVPASEAVGRRVAETLQRELESGDERPAGEREVAILRGGDEVWLSLTEAVMHDDSGAVAGRVFAFRDVSAERAVETMKSEFVAAVSHELRTPLTSIYGFAETLMRQDVQFEETDRATFLGYIASESERLIRIVDDLLNVARLEAGTLGLDLGPVDLGEVVAGVVKSESKTGHRFDVDVPAGLVALADRGRLGEVVHHLVANAIKLSPPGGTITIVGRARSDTVELRVVDEGAGIALADRKRLFTKLFHGAEGGPDPEGGTGVGLFLARGLVAAMRGRLWVESEEKGSSFVFELPASNQGASGRRG